MDVGLTVVLIVLIVCVHDFLIEIINIKKNKDNCMCKRTEKFKNMYEKVRKEKDENKKIDNTLSSDMWRS